MVHQTYIKQSSGARSSNRMGVFGRKFLNAFYSIRSVYICICTCGYTSTEYYLAELISLAHFQLRIECSLCVGESVSIFASSLSGNFNLNLPTVHSDVTDYIQDVDRRPSIDTLVAVTANESRKKRKEAKKKTSFIYELHMCTTSH